MKGAGLSLPSHNLNTFLYHFDLAPVHFPPPVIDSWWPISLILVSHGAVAYHFEHRPCESRHIFTSGSLHLGSVSRKFQRFSSFLHQCYTDFHSLSYDCHEEVLILLPLLRHFLLARPLSIVGK